MLNEKSELQIMYYMVCENVVYTIVFVYTHTHREQGVDEWQLGGRISGNF